MNGGEGAEEPMQESGGEERVSEASGRLQPIGCRGISSKENLEKERRMTLMGGRGED